MIKVFKYMKPYIGMVLMAVALLFVQASCDLALPDYMGNIVNEGVIPGDIPRILETGLLMLIITFVGTAASVIVGYFASMTAANVIRDMRMDIFNKVLAFSSAEMDKFSTSSLITRTTNDLTQIQLLLVMGIRMVFYAPILGTGGVIKALSNSASMTWVIGVGVIVMVGFIMTLFFIALPKFQMVQKLVDRLNLVTRENLDGILVIRAFNTQNFELDRFDVANKELTDTNLFVNRAMSIMMPFIMLAMNVITVVIVWVGARMVSDLKMDLGTMMSYMQYAMQIVMAFIMISMMFIFIPRAAVSAKRVEEVLETDETVLESENPLKFNKDNFDSTIEYKNVSFRYPGGEGDVLKNISFIAKTGETTAVIGSTGSGKSTLVNLLLRLYDVTGGEILIGGKDIRKVLTKDLRQAIGYVPQKSLLFSGTIKSNLQYGDRSATEENIEKSARIAQADDFISEKEDGFESPISQGGTNVSGGQRQRLSIARALVKNSPIYVFDDSFSALDLKTDSKLRSALKGLPENTTILLVAQRISTIMEADQILVLDNGRIVGKGKHRELLKTCEVYREIAGSQLSEEELSR
ncbi:MAG: ABC transporter ATP-binding protein/permease [Eubacterium sp.]|jgi:ATP-binding cassette subfamily B protein|nr:ABC transporter ATP-binding protein/permease [Eubacterium sp.]